MKIPRILIAEDKRALLAVADALAGYELSKATTTSQALALAAEGDFDLFVIGLHFDQSKGMELASAIREDPQYFHTPILLIRILPIPSISSLRKDAAGLVTSGILNEYLEFDHKIDLAYRLGASVAAKLLAAQEGVRT